MTLWPWEQGTLSSGSWEFSGSACPHTWFALWSMTLAAGSWGRGLWLAPQQYGEAQLNPLLCLKQEGGSWPTCLSPNGDEGRALFPRHHTREANPATHAGPTTQQYRGFKAGDGSLEIMCKYANYFIMSLAWSGTHRANKILAATEMGKVKRSSERDAKLPHLVFALCVSEVGKKAQGWPGKAWHLHLALHGYLHCAWLMQLNMDTLAGMCSCTKWHLCCVCSTCASFLAMSRKSWVVEKETPWASAFFVLWSRKSKLAVRKCILFAEFFVQCSGAGGLKGWGGTYETPGVTTSRKFWENTGKSSQDVHFFHPPPTTGVTLAAGQLAALSQAWSCSTDLASPSPQALQPAPTS